MRFSLVICAVSIITIAPLNISHMRTSVSHAQAPLPAPLPPDASIQVATPEAIDMESIARTIENELHPESRHPRQIVIPSIGVNSWVVNVGLTSNGEIEVPDGSTSDVGWYQYGAIPGDTGSAVMDAHVYAAFKKLKKLKVGSTIYVYNARGEELRFEVISTKVYPLAQVPMNTIVNDSSGEYLNLITCAGRFVRSWDTYSHRQVVYAKLVK